MPKALADAYAVLAAPQGHPDSLRHLASLIVASATGNTPRQTKGARG